VVSLAEESVGVGLGDWALSIDLQPIGKLSPGDAEALMQAAEQHGFVRIQEDGATLTKGGRAESQRVRMRRPSA
jgi:hypothetical protein